MKNKGAEKEEPLFLVNLKQHQMEKFKEMIHHEILLKPML
jgi:hypothetical protein